MTPPRSEHTVRGNEQNLEAGIRNALKNDVKDNSPTLTVTDNVT